MKLMIAIAIAAAVGLVGWSLYQQWEEVAPDAPAPAAAPLPKAGGTGQELSGMPAALEAALAEAHRKGAVGLRRFLDRHGHRIEDPRLAWIELDYVVLVANRDHAEARRVFARVQARVGEDSPVYPRVQRLADTFGMGRTSHYRGRGDF